jgi:hypothetical protein
LGQQGFNETRGIGKAVSETADQVFVAANNSDVQGEEQYGRRVRFVVSLEMFILIGIAICKIVLWCLYRSARDEGLDVTNP